jgi:UrcA family protein
MKSHIVLASILFSAAVAGSPAAAESARFAGALVDAPMTVRVSDVDANSTRGATILLRRIRQAARKTCGADPHASRQLNHWRLHRYCLERNTDAAVAALGAPLVTALHRDGVPPAPGPAQATAMLK